MIVSVLLVKNETLGSEELRRYVTLRAVERRDVG